MFEGLTGRLASIGLHPGDDERTRTIKAILVRIALLALVAGPCLCVYDALTGFAPGVLITLPFSLLVAYGVWRFAGSGEVRPFRRLLLIAVLLFPAVAMWVRGGFAHSGASIVWALAAPVFAVMLHGPRRAVPWFLAYAALLLFSAVIDGACQARALAMGIPAKSWFFFVHLGGTSLCTFLLLRDYAYRLRQEQERAERLLLNVLPAEIADRLKGGATTIADAFPEVTVLFADLAGFTPLAAGLEPAAVVTLLNRIFTAFDRLAEQHGLEKIKTIGDAYMAVAGLPQPRPDHAEAAADMALAMLAVTADLEREFGRSLSLRIGLNTGPVVAGVIGLSKFTYDLWGDAVNLASRLESSGVPGTVQVSQASRDRLAASFELEPRGIITIKGKGDLPTWFLRGRHSLVSASPPAGR